MPERNKKHLFLHVNPPNLGVKAFSGIGVKIKNGMRVKQWSGIYNMNISPIDQVMKFNPRFNYCPRRHVCWHKKKSPFF